MTPTPDATPTLAAEIEALAANHVDDQGISDAECIAVLLDGYAADRKRENLPETARTLDRAAEFVRAYDTVSRNLPAIVTALRQAEAVPGVVEGEAHTHVRNGDYRMGYLKMCRAALRDIAEAQAIPNYAEAFLRCRRVAQEALLPAAPATDEGERS